MNGCLKLKYNFSLKHFALTCMFITVLTLFRVFILAARSIDFWITQSPPFRNTITVPTPKVPIIVWWIITRVGWQNNSNNSNHNPTQMARLGGLPCLYLFKTSLLLFKVYRHKPHKTENQGKQANQCWTESTIRSVKLWRNTSSMLNWFNKLNKKTNKQTNKQTNKTKKQNKTKTKQKNNKTKQNKNKNKKITEV